MKAKFLISKSKVMSQFEIVKGTSDMVSYSSKTNQVITSILEENTDCFFSVHLEPELKHVKDYSRVIFLAQGWDDSQISMLIEKGVKWFVVDNLEDLRVLKESIGEKADINVLLRLKLKEHTIRTEKYYVFGMYSKDIEKEIDELKSRVKSVGIHFHRKTQNMSEWNLKFELSNTFSDDFLSKLDVVCIGGGLPSEYANTNKDVLDGIFAKIKELKSWLNGFDVKMMIEPGRFIAAPAGKLITEVIAVHEDTIIVNASVYNGDLDALIVPVKLLVEGEKEEKTEQGEEGVRQYVIKGITPCSMDLFRYKVFLDEKKKGDTIVFLNAGAYNFSSDFCDMEPLETEVVE